MDTTTIASLASNIATNAPSDRVGVAVLKKALDIEATNALALIQASAASLRASIFPPISGKISTLPLSLRLSAA